MNLLLSERSNRKLTLAPPPVFRKSKSSLSGSTMWRNVRYTPPTSIWKNLAGSKAARVTMSGLKVPNLRPDIVTRAAFDPAKFFHIDVGGVYRTFRHIVEPLNEDLDFRKTGGGASVNLRFDLSDSNKFILQGSYGSG